MQFWVPQILCIFDTQNLWISIFKLCFRFICWRGVALSIWDFSNMFWSCFSFKRSHYFCVFSFVGVVLWKFSFWAESTCSVYVVIYIPDEFLWTWKFFHRIFWNLENILNTFIDLIFLIFMEIWSTLAKLFPKKPVLLPKIICILKPILEYFDAWEWKISFFQKVKTISKIWPEKL